MTEPRFQTGEPLMERPEAPRRFRIAASFVLLALAAMMLFARLGHYGLNPDEADTVLFARAVWETGDTSARVGHNLTARHNGELLVDGKNRVTPPLPYWLVAPVWGAAGPNAATLRAPFALCGLLGVMLAISWLWLERASVLTWLLIGGGLLGNVSLYLYSRQCRYHVLTMLLSLVIAFLYIRFRGQRDLALMALASLALLATDYLGFAALYACLGIDYSLWGRQRTKLTGRDWLLLIGPQIVVGVALLTVWNPANRTPLPEFSDHNWLGDKLHLLAWNFRDLNACEFAVGPFLLAALLLHSYVADPWLLRAPLAMGVYVVIVTLMSPQPVALSSSADVRHLAAVIPLGIFLSACVLKALAQKAPWWIVTPVAILALATNVWHFPMSPEWWRSAPLEFAGELASPRVTATQLAGDWLNEHAHNDDTVWVVPDFQAIPGKYFELMRTHLLVHDNAYSLMVHEPRPTYGWQLLDPPPVSLSDVSTVQINGRLPVDWIVAYGWFLREHAQDVIRQYEAKGIRYELAAKLPCDPDDGTQPDLLRHKFRAAPIDPELDAVFIFHRIYAGPRP